MQLIPQHNTATRGGLRRFALKCCTDSRRQQERQYEPPAQATPSAAINARHRVYHPRHVPHHPSNREAKEGLCRVGNP